MYLRPSLPLASLARYNIRKMATVNVSASYCINMHTNFLHVFFNFHRKLAKREDTQRRYYCICILSNSQWLSLFLFQLNLKCRGVKLKVVNGESCQVYQFLLSMVRWEAGSNWAPPTIQSNGLISLSCFKILIYMFNDPALIQ